jgi:predicted nucleic acid-binding protein
LGLIRDLGTGIVGLDTAAFIYYIEEHPEYIGALAPVFDAVATGRLNIVTSGLTLLEVLVVPLRAGNVALAAQYEDILTRSRGVRLVEIDLGQLRAAAQLRAVHGALRTPGALQLAAASASRCSAFVTNHRHLPAIPGLRLLRLRDYARG